MTESTVLKSAIESGPEWTKASQDSDNIIYMISKMDLLSDSGMQGIQVVLSASDLETVVRNVLSEVISEHSAPKKDVKISRVAAAKRLGKNLSTLNRWARVGKVHPIHIGASVYFRLSEIEAIEEGRL